MVAIQVLNQGVGILFIVLILLSIKRNPQKKWYAVPGLFLFSQVIIFYSALLLNAAGIIHIDVTGEVFNVWSSCLRTLSEVVGGVLTLAHLEARKPNGMPGGGANEHK
jgi:hypothetical protein